VPRTVSTRNAAFQQWQALLTNRTKRQRAGEFLVQGVRPITLAAEHGWDIRTLLHAGAPRSRWADELLSRYDHVELSDELMRELGEKDEQELIALVGLPEDRLDRIPQRDDLLVVVFDRPATPGNIGTLIRSADAFGAHGVIVTGHAADPYDPRSVRAPARCSRSGSCVCPAIARCLPGRQGESSRRTSMAPPMWMRWTSPGQLLC
jgi:TrmH family RNA methyltransferase